MIKSYNVCDVSVAMALGNTLSGSRPGVQRVLRRDCQMTLTSDNSSCKGVCVLNTITTLQFKIQYQLMLYQMLIGHRLPPVVASASMDVLCLLFICISYSQLRSDIQPQPQRRTASE